ncbi:hypothetical protein P170DRAFT_433443 [Aspergillus steynii IBT 23096]|uniref:Extracellular membrane protein CFEM domain-containing protein n=1 Tax=Aspergillus steynii IBT 23096 TaxID=1392250 RepID=A0A2I2GF09_9EURO|nr:uncharacterized protein P170DRAFT_433443 [Aspergillus steynii IBT 23096]PLB51456.1 hypothetical protein P170DRAFT_433443 [Aspergillus steynii IBT 23096]
MRFSTSVLLGLLAANVSIAAKVGKFDADKCADPSGLKTCYDKAKSTYNDCVKKNCDKEENGKTVDDPDCLDKCACTRDRARIDCAASSCWNQVYSCEYQLTVSDLAETCDKPDLDNIPFYPAPDNAPGGCSCAVGKVNKAMLEATKIQGNQCDLKSSASDSEIEECMCCGYSAILSSLPDTCPNTKLSELSIDDLEAAIEQAGWKDCASTLEKVDCAKKFSYPKLDTYYKPGKLPNGTATLSNTGSSSITSPVSGATFTWTAGSSDHVVTAQSTDAAKATGSSASATSGDSASGTASASATATTGAAVRVGMDSYLFAGLAVAAVFVQA